MHLMDLFELPKHESATIENDKSFKRSQNYKLEKVYVKEEHFASEPLDSDPLLIDFEQAEVSVKVKMENIHNENLDFHDSETSMRDENFSSSPVYPSTSDFYPHFFKEKTNIPEMEERENPQKSQKVVSNQNRFVCCICGRIFARKANLARHLSSVHTGDPRPKEKPATCELCNRTFCNKSVLNRHLVIHSGKKAFSCEYCHRSFSRKEHLTRHITCHSEKRPFSCDFCSKSFPTNSDLTRHILIHSGERPFSCETCNKGFLRKSALSSHLFIHSGERPFPCERCNKRFVTKSDLKKHLFIHFKNLDIS